MSNSDDTGGDNDRKYDRQVRIWGDDGQQALGRGSICVLNASTVATELLKNLVLAGIASFTIVDGNNVCPQDQATNFFLTSRHPPSADAASDADDFDLKPVNRGRAVVDAMFELNDSVIGSYIPEHAENFLTSVSSARAFVRSFSVVVYTQVSQLSRGVQVVSSACATLNIPFVYVRAYGLCAQLRLQMYPYFVVRNARSEGAETLDLHINAPFPALAKFAEEVDVEKQGAHVPFVVLLIRAVHEFRKAYGKLPSTRVEKDALAKLVESFRPQTINSAAENYAEALRPAHLRLCHAAYEQISSQVASVLRHPRTKFPTLRQRQSVHPASPEVASEVPSLPSALRVARRTRVGSAMESPAGGATNEGVEHGCGKDDEFWVCVVAVKSFTEKYRRLPVSGALPDMNADTQSYIALQKLYKEQAREDAAFVHQFAGQFVNNHHQPLSIPDKRVVQSFCRTVRHIRVISSRTLEQEVADSDIGCGASNNAHDGENGLEDEFYSDLTAAVDKNGDFADAAMAEGAFDPACANTCAAPFYVALRASDLFERQHGRLPGTQDSVREADVFHMQGLASKVREQLGLSGSDTPSWREVIEETVRYGGVETHSVAAFIGGVAAQEVTKLATGQFVPLHDTLIVNMANMTSVTFRA